MQESDNSTEVVQMLERPSSNGKVSGSIPDSVTFLDCWLKRKNIQPLCFSVSLSMKLWLKNCSNSNNNNKKLIINLICNILFSKLDFSVNTFL